MRTLLRAAVLGLVVLCLSLAGWSSAEDAAKPEPRPRTVLVLRHAEKAREPGDDPALSERGERRAAEVARLFARLKPAAVWATPFRRTRSTVEPLAKAAGVEVRTLPAADIAAFAAACQALDDGATAIVCGHSNTVPKLVAALGGELGGLDATGNLPDGEYTRAALVVLPPKGAAGATQVLELALEP